MPLLTDDLNRARRAYDALESRARSAEECAATLQADNAKLVAADPTALLRQRVLDLEGENLGLKRQIERLAQVKSDLPLQGFVESLGLAAAIGEASMPDRAIASIKAELQTYLSPMGASLGLRFQQPELGAQPGGLSSTSFEILKVPPQPGNAAPSNLYAVLQELQRVYTDPVWLRFEQARRIVAEVSMALSDSGRWDFPYLVQTAGTVATLQKEMVGLIAGGATVAAIKDYERAAAELEMLVAALRSKANPVAGDVYALTSALKATAAAAASLVP